MSRQNTKSSWLSTLILIVAILFLIFGCVAAYLIAILFGEDIDYWFKAQQTRQSISTIQPEFEQAMQQFRSITNHVILEERVSELDVSPIRPYCIEGGITFIFGSNLSFDEVVAEYRTWSIEENWVYVSVGGHFFRDTNDRISAILELIEDRENLSPEWLQYQTIYSLYTHFSYRNFGACHG